MCSIILVKVSGALVCLITPLTKTNKFKIVCEETTLGSGIAKEKKYWNEAGTEVTLEHEGANPGLLTFVNEGAGKGSAENTTAEITTNKEITIDA